ncbi:hypothetical protein QO002_002382 [Pararhizobium capsulatum DSM 1112]|uniref:Uncharacterized protein n=1 Tax=Pararhizobium capsulatum DSM 1112 TaxID=1121113 RepID=A0ABU0BR80_9HYPH|nr:hypothetical protein [Pararhizobium capsulatum]MDQ0320244.1 hypothetical protein [Pararhizobium capsulatum DSM 1112]
MIHAENEPFYAPPPLRGVACALTRELEAIPEDDIEDRMELLASKVPGLPLLADCLAKDQQLKEKQELTAKILGRLGPDEPGTSASIPWQSSLAYKDIFDNLLAKSPVLTRADIEEAKNIPLPTGGRGYFIEELKTRRRDGSLTEWHWPLIIITDDGKRYFLEGVWNLYSIETANKDEQLLADLYGDVTKNFKRMPAPDTTFQRFHGGTAIGPEDMTLGGEYEPESTYAVNSEKAFGWDAEKEGRPFWHVRNVLEFQNLSPERLHHLIAVASLVKKSNDKGSPLSTGTHYILNSCVTLLIAALFYDDPELQNRPLHDLMITLSEKADVIHFSNDPTTTVEDFLNGRNGFCQSDAVTFRRQVIKSMKMPTLRESYDKKPPVISCYFTNHLQPKKPVAKLLSAAEELSLQALRKMAADLP